MRDAITTGSVYILVEIGRRNEMVLKFYERSFSFKTAISLKDI